MSTTEYTACVCTDDEHQSQDLWGGPYTRASVAMAAKVAAARFHPDAHVVATFTSVIR